MYFKAKQRSMAENMACRPCAAGYETGSYGGNKMIAVQDTYGERFQYCWGCGPKNEHGLHLKSFPSEDGNKCICSFVPGKDFTGGVPNNLYGGMMVMAFDCHGTASAAWFFHRSRGLTLTENTVIHRFITARLEIDFKKPIPMGKTLTVTATPEEISERKVIVSMIMEADGQMRAMAKIVAVGVKDDM